MNRFNKYRDQAHSVASPAAAAGYASTTTPAAPASPAWHRNLRARRARLRLSARVQHTASYGAVLVGTVLGRHHGSMAPRMSGWSCKGCNWTHPASHTHCVWSDKAPGAAVAASSSPKAKARAKGKGQGQGPQRTPTQAHAAHQRAWAYLDAAPATTTATGPKGAAWSDPRPSTHEPGPAA